MQGQCPRGAGPEPDVFHTHIPCWGEADVSSWSVFAQLTVYFHRRTISIHLSIRSLPDDKHVTLAPKTRDLRNIEIPFMLLLWGFAGIFPPALSNNVIVWVILSHTFFLLSFICSSYDFLIRQASRAPEKDLHTNCLFHMCVTSSVFKWKSQESFHFQMK